MFNIGMNLLHLLAFVIANNYISDPVQQFNLFRALGLSKTPKYTESEMELTKDYTPGLFNKLLGATDTPANKMRHAVHGGYLNDPAARAKFQKKVEENSELLNSYGDFYGL